MSIFKKTETPPVKPRERATTHPRGNQADGAISIIGAGMSVIGDINTEGIVRIEGSVEGTIRAGKSVVLGQSGVVIGNIITEDAVVGGTITGSIVASARLELQSTSTVSGEIRTRAEHLKLEEGARFAGKVQMIEEGEVVLPQANSDSRVRELHDATPKPEVMPLVRRGERGHDEGEKADLVVAGKTDANEAETAEEDGNLEEADQKKAESKR